EKQENYTNTINDCAKRLNLELITLDPGLLGVKEVEKINDYSVINDWFEEKFDVDKDGAPIFNTNEIGKVITKYGTQYVLKTGVATIVTITGKKRTYFYGYLFDLKSNSVIYKRYDYFK